MKALPLLLLVTGCSMQFNSRTGPPKDHCYTYEGERHCFADEQEMRDDYRERFRAHLNARRGEGKEAPSAPEDDD